MDNPFKAGDIVTTKIKGQQVEATVNQVWNQEVQIRTADKKLLWRTVKTVTFVSPAVISVSKSSGTLPQPEYGSREGKALVAPPLPNPSKKKPSKKQAQPLKNGPAALSKRYQIKRSRHPKRPKI